MLHNKHYLLRRCCISLWSSYKDYIICAVLFARVLICVYFFFLKGISPQTEDSVPEPVAAATDGILATDASAVPATGSARHSRHSSEMIPTKDSDHDNGDHDDTDLAYRPRPPISEDLFQMPVTPEPQDSTEINPGAYIHVQWSLSNLNT